MVSAWHRLNRLVLAALVVTLASGRAAVAQEEGTCTIAVLGDSLTASYGMDLPQGFPARLEASLRERGRACSVLDAGVSGDTSAGGLSRLDWVLADKPTHLIVELGANDMLRALPTDQLERNLDAIVERAQSRGVHVFLAGMLAAPNLGEAYGEAFRQVYADIAERRDIPLYPFFLDGVAGVRELNQPDGIHPTAAGVAVVVERILPSVLAWLDATGVAVTPRS